MYPILIFADSRERCDYLKETVATIDRRVCVECCTDTEELVGLARCRHPLLAVASAQHTSLVLRATMLLRQEDHHLPILIEIDGERPLEALQAIALGATDYIKRPVAAWEWQQRCRLLLESARQREALHAALDRAARRYPHRFTEREVLACADALHDSVTGAHDYRTGRIAGIIARALMLPEQECRHIEWGASLHDIGKIGIPDEVLRRPGRFSDEDRQVMRAHPQLGYEILKNGMSDGLQLGADIALTHHERFDGSGYPRGTAGEAIPLAGRITAVADVFDALTDGRIYHHSMSVPEGMDYIGQHRGTLFDPDCVDALRLRLDDIGAIVPPLPQ